MISTEYTIGESERLQDTLVSRLLHQPSRERSLISSSVLALSGLRSGDNYGDPCRSAADIIGSSRALRASLDLALTVAPVNSTVLIQGETGTGKELIAQLIHRNSPRSDRPFVRLNCAAIPLELLESELFGYERGAFTGALNRKIGRFEAAHQGSLFLDEIGDIRIELQAKLLRVLQEGEFERLGGNQTVRVNVRLIGATHRDLAELVSNGEFRSDLYYRLNVFPITVPPLRERQEDIVPLVMHFVQAFGCFMNKNIVEVPEEALKAMQDYSWPGNIRELRNFIERSVILSSGPTLRAPIKDLRQVLTVPAGTPVTLKDAEREHICRTLKETKGVVAGPGGAAARLGIKRSTLYFRMRKLGISLPHRVHFVNQESGQKLGCREL